ncbi:hypothetical protein [Candidatus Contubernalis alkaliaceticus]|uniref:hypothetical protein n=1 Tax=Candidatus Contubernalis alkaliaceticus TaxID=338645 RepID=UPI001F4C36AA|nr:hypothetical protein [Candidatus Contubernalis alkalaceticus]UNC93414.1 hypothetical protein HUE98_15820 [Candidatus Contubernalis alkalaceticus]
MSGEWQVKNIYLHLVCFVTLMMIIGGIVSTFNTGLEMLFPWRHSTSLMDMYLHEEAPHDPYSELPKLQEHLKENPPDWQRLEEVRTAREQREADSNHIYKLRTLLGSLALFIIPLPFYYYHWKKIKPQVENAGGGVDYES